MQSFKPGEIVSVGEAMIEMAVTHEGLYRRGFAGDTFNTIWHMAQVLGNQFDLGFVTKVGVDSLSDAFIEELDKDGLMTKGVCQVSERTMGLYMIEIDGVERHFHYWRNQSAAKLLADDEIWLRKAFGEASLVHLSGITLAILSEDARLRLFNTLKLARTNGTRVSFDPNIRPRLWASRDELCSTLQGFLSVTDIALPSFKDEANYWGDRSPEDTLNRFLREGVDEIVVKNGSKPIVAMADGKMIVKTTTNVSGVSDTSGAGDAFNAGYLASRLMGHNPEKSVVSGQKLAGEVIRHFGARTPKDRIPSLF